MKIQILVALLSTAALLLTHCGVSSYQSNSQPISHEIWDSLLHKHVNNSGEVNYKGFVADSLTLRKYLHTLSNNHPNTKNWSEAERLAYWINAYNAFTVKLILDHYPVASIKDIKNGIPFVNTVWDIKFVKIEGATYDLNNIEHSILRKRFDEPRIHFAVNCASISCPRLRNEAYQPDRLEAQLLDQAGYFINRSGKNHISADQLQLSRIFSWFKKDFTKKGNLIDFLNQYTEVKIRKDASIDHLGYDWRLNEEKSGKN